MAAAAAIGAEELERDLGPALELARGLVEQHRYEQVIELMAPFAAVEDAEARYAVRAEAGRAHFHLGEYNAAHALLEEAVRLRPRRIETGLYLMATSYLTGEVEQAYRILREVLRSGATDLYLAVTLPGERAFLSDREVRRMLTELARPVQVDIDRGSALGVALGQRRADVEAGLGFETGPAAPKSVVTAHAGPFLTWAFGFDDSGTLTRIMAHNEHLLRYTPFRLDLDHDLDWRATPIAATRALGAPASTSRGDGEVVVMAWHRGPVRLTLEFGRPRAPAPPGIDDDGPMLRVVRLETADP